MNWHEPTNDEVNGIGEHRYLIDIQPDVVPHQAANDGDALLLIGKPGWSWILLDKYPPKKKSGIIDMGCEDTKDAAIGSALAKLAEIRA